MTLDLIPSACEEAIAHQCVVVPFFSFYFSYPTSVRDFGLNECLLLCVCVCAAGVCALIRLSYVSSWQSHGL